MAPALSAAREAADMKRLLLAVGLYLGLIAPSLAANSTVSAMTAASALTGTELLYCVQSSADRKCTPAQLSTYIQSLISGDCSISSNVITCTKTNGAAFGTLATLTPGTGVATALGIAVGS